MPVRAPRPHESCKKHSLFFFSGAFFGLRRRRDFLKRMRPLKMKPARSQIHRNICCPSHVFVLEGPGLPLPVLRRASQACLDIDDTVCAWCVCVCLLSPTEPKWRSCAGARSASRHRGCRAARTRRRRRPGSGANSPSFSKICQKLKIQRTSFVDFKKQVAK